MRKTFWWMAAWAIGSGNLAAGEVMPVTPYLGGYETAQPMVVVGSASGSPPITPEDRVNANSPMSPFAGVVSIFASNDMDTPATGFIGSGVAITPRHILTAAHVVDWTGGQRAIANGFDDTGDGILDAVPSLSRVFLNAGPTEQLGIDRIDLHQDWHGFLNINGPASESPPSINDDLAIVTLSQDLPAHVPIYSIWAEPFMNVREIVIVGYGQTGHGDVGFVGPAAFATKRYGFNLATQYILDDEAPHQDREMFQFDFDGPDGDTDADDIIGLGNEFEVTIGPGDSGGPSFLFSDLNNDGDITADELALFGINTFGMPGIAEAPLFGSWGGGMVVSSYLDFITGVIPEPGMGSVIMGLMLLAGGRRRR